MAPKRLSTEEIYHLMKRFKASEASSSSTPPPPSPSSSIDPPPPLPEPESPASRLRREAVEEFKRSSEFGDLLAVERSSSFAKEFYACRNWVSTICLNRDFRGLCISVLPSQFRFFLAKYLEKEADALRKKLEDEAFAAAEEAAEAAKEEGDEDGVDTLEEEEEQDEDSLGPEDDEDDDES